MSLGVKVNRYQSWYGEKCPYTKPAIKIKNTQQTTAGGWNNEEREYIPSISKRLITQTNKEIILGPKRERPSSALRPSTIKAHIMPIRPSSALRTHPNRVPESHQHHENGTGLDNSPILKISPAFDHPILDKSQKNMMRSKSKPIDTSRLSKPPGVESVRDIDILTQRKIVPSVDKKYLKSRPISPKQVDINHSMEIVPVEETSSSHPPHSNTQPHPHPPPLLLPHSASSGPHPELIKRSLFVAGLRNTVKSVEESDNQQKQDLLCVQNSHPTDQNCPQPQPVKPHRPRAQTTIVPSKKTDFQVPNKENSTHRSSVRVSMLKSGNKSQGKEEAPLTAIGKILTTPRSSPKRSPIGSEDADEENSAGEEDLSARDENISYPLYSIVEARYKGRSHWWTGKIVQTRLDGTYDIQFGDILERHVSPALIRPKPSVDFDSMKKKIRMTGMLASTLRESFESIQRSDSEGTDMEDEPNAMTIDALLHRTSSSSASGGGVPPPQHRDASSPGGRSLVRKTIVRVLSIGSLPPVVEDVPSLLSSEIGSGGGPGTGTGGVGTAVTTRRNLFAQIAAGAHKLKKVENQMEAAAEAIAEANRRHEQNEQTRLWPEIQKVVMKFRCEIPFEDVKILSKLGEGKFASVHAAEMTVRLHNKVFTNREGVKRTLERLGNNLNKIQCGVKNLSLSCALKVLEYMGAYPLDQGKWEQDRPPEKDYSDTSVYTDESEVTALEREELEGKRERSNSMNEQYDPSSSSLSTQQQQDQQTQQTQPSFQEKYKPMPPSKSILESLREIKALTTLQHKNIVMLHGVILVPRLILVMERLQFNLHELLITPPEEQQIKLTPSQRLTLLHDVSSGLAYIHNNSYIHRDIKTHNILVSAGVGGYVAKIADFGTSLHISKGRKLGECVGTLGYTAPEVLEQPASYDISADIFSLAILMWDTLQPFEHRVDNPLTHLSPEDAPKQMSQGLRPSLGHCLLPAIHPLIEKCWATLPSSRLSSDSIVTELTQQIVST